MMKLFSALLLLLSSIVAVAAPPRYMITDLGPGEPYAINEAGTVVGTGIDFYVPGGKGIMQGINDNGQSVGWLSMGVIDNRALSNAHQWDNSGIHNLAPYNYPSYANDINNSGTAVGYSFPNWGSFYPVIWDVNGMRILTEIGTTGTANAINNSGQIVGTGHGGGSAWILDQDGVRFLSKPEGRLAQAYAVSENGYIAGLIRWTDPTQGMVNRACYWDSDGWHDIGWLDGLLGNSFAKGINSSKQIVGSSGNTAWSGESHAFLWQDSVLYDLNDLIDPASNWQLLEARAINDKGQIAVKGWDGERAPHSLLLTPVPEQSSLLALLTGAGLFYARRRTIK